MVRPFVAGAAHAWRPVVRGHGMLLSVLGQLVGAVLDLVIGLLVP
ncbi:hypothetical protein [Nocardia bovistercoris]|nr:hypothetical protein [Nocardia bovistercoris]